MKCENCQLENDGKYGSGRFCSSKCARSFATKNNRKEINEKVSKTLSKKFSCGKITKPVGCFKKGYDPRRRKFTKKDREKAILSTKTTWENYIQSTSFEKLSRNVKKRIILQEQNRKCLLCGIDKWEGKLLNLQLDHIDGNRNNEKRENLRILCPNCHSITETYGGKNKFKRTATNDELWNAINSCSTIHSALKSLEMNNGRNYARAKKLVLERGVEPLKTKV